MASILKVTDLQHPGASTPNLTLDSVGNVSISGVFYKNAKNVAANYTVASGSNEMSVGPITINEGVTVTVSGNWSIL